MEERKYNLDVGKGKKEPVAGNETKSLSKNSQNF
jgi:hypothetical protein